VTTKRLPRTLVVSACGLNETHLLFWRRTHTAYNEVFGSLEPERDKFVYHPTFIGDKHFCVPISSIFCLPFI